MSKKVTAVSNTVLVGGFNMFLASDGSVRICGHDRVKKGYVVTQHDEVAVTKDGIAAIKQSVKLLVEAKKLKDKLTSVSASIIKIKKGNPGPYGPLLMDSSGVTVGCTTVKACDIPRYIKALGL